MFSVNDTSKCYLTLSMPIANHSCHIKQYTKAEIHYLYAKLPLQLDSIIVVDRILIVVEGDRSTTDSAAEKGGCFVVIAIELVSTYF
jgi:hypothetical protein